jgi:hypothetical protein
MTDEKRHETTERETAQQTKAADRQEAGRQTMAEVSHTNPSTGETFGTVYRRGPAVTDGGAADARGTDADPSAETDETGDRESMREVDHTPRGGEGANEVWERGGEENPDVSDGDQGDE